MVMFTSNRVLHRVLATWFFGFALLLFIFYVFMFAPERLPEFKQRIVALICALLSGFFGYFFTGSIRVKLTPLRTRFGDTKVDAAGGLALFILVLVWWMSPFAPIRAGDGIVTVRVTVLGSNKMPTEEAQVWFSVGGEVKKIAGGWEIEIPVSNLPRNGKFTVYAAQQSEHLKGQSVIAVGNRDLVTASIQLERDMSAKVRGTVFDNKSRVPIEGATVSIIGTADAVLTNNQGYFCLPAHAAIGEQIRLHISKTGYQSVDQYHLADEEPAYIFLERAW
jgi:hypothetical protein